jgi:fructose-1,6-bisphosphatase/inositol monophosphatase family enzyme
VVAALEEAGELLRSEARREGGPRGHGHRADVDAEIEDLLVARLAAAAPDAGFVCEEKPERQAGAGRRAFVIDPHDGTSSFLRGRRETSLSVGLVEDGRLALGAVYAPCLSLLDADDPLRAVTGGEALLVTWAEGAPLHVNGAPCAPAPPPDALAAGSRVLVSRKSKPARLAAHERVLEPARLVQCASIATRLALVAVGRADATLTWSNPRAAWDLAGGQALVRAAGGEVVALDGAEIAWRGILTEHPIPGACFAARSLVLARHVAARYRDWHP